MNAHTPCAEEGCERSPATGHPLYRTNAKGEKGVFKCYEHSKPKPPEDLVEITELINQRNP